MLYRLSGYLPLLDKELAESAEKRRTYVLRTIYGLITFIAFFIYYFLKLNETNYTLSKMLGLGRVFFDYVIYLNFIGIYLFLPGAMSGAVTSEKESGTLPLLILTDMTPFSLLLQKYLGRMLPFFFMIMMSVPLMALAFTMGGVSHDAILSAFLLLILTCLQVGAFALLWSCWCMHTSTAVIASYIGLAIFYFIVPVMSATSFRSLENSDLQYLLPPMIYFRIGIGDELAKLVMRSFPLFVSIIVFFFYAKLFFTRRVFYHPGRVSLEVMNFLDNLYKRLNDKFGSVVLADDSNTLPEKNPLRWRELEKRRGNSLRHIIRSAVFNGLVGFMFAFVACLSSFRDDSHNVWVLNASILIFFYIIIAVVNGAQVINSERASGTLELLLCSPIKSCNIILEKSVYFTRGNLLGIVAIFTLHTTFFYVLGDLGTVGDILSNLVYVIEEVLVYLILTRMFYWCAVLAGIIIKSTTRTLFFITVVFASWQAVVSVLPTLNNSVASRNVLSYLSPLNFVVLVRERLESPFDGRNIVALIIFAGIYLLAKHVALSYTDKFFRRPDENNYIYEPKEIG